MGTATSILKETIENLANQGIYLDAETIASATCPLEEFANQWNRKYWSLGSQSASRVKMDSLMLIDIAAPILEELFFRGLIQDVLLKPVIAPLIRG